MIFRHYISPGSNTFSSEIAFPQLALFQKQIYSTAKARCIRCCHVLHKEKQNEVVLRWNSWLVSIRISRLSIIPIWNESWVMAVVFKNFKALNPIGRESNFHILFSNTKVWWREDESLRSRSTTLSMISLSLFNCRVESALSGESSIREKLKLSVNLFD